MQRQFKTRIVAHHTPDQGWSWVIALSCCCINAIIFGIYRSFGVLYVALLQTYNVSRESAAWPFSLCLTVFHMTGLVSGALSNHYTTRSICISGCLIAAIGITSCYFTTSVVQVGVLIGVVKGFGIGLIGTQSPVIINQYFKKYRATASGIALAGGTIGSFILPPLARLIIEEYSLKGCFLILGGIILQTIPVAFLLRPPTQKSVENEVEKGVNEKALEAKAVEAKAVEAKAVGAKAVGAKAVEAKETSGDDSIEKPPLKERFSEAVKSTMDLVRDLSRNPLFVVLCLTQVSFTWGWTTYVMVIVDHAVDRGIGISQAVMLLSAFAAADLCGRLGSGWISDKGLVKRRNVACVSIMSIGILLWIIPTASTFSVFLTISLALGLFCGSIMILFSILLVEYVGIEMMPVALGSSTFACGVATIARPAVIGYFRDVHGSYDGLFQTLGAASMVTATLWLGEPLFQLWQQKKSIIYEFVKNHKHQPQAMVNSMKPTQSPSGVCPS